MHRKNPLSSLAFAGSISVAWALAGCASGGRTVSDLALGAAGGVAGYKLSNGNVGLAAAGATAGYIGSKVVQSNIDTSVLEAEQRGYDRAMNQAVKQQYWIIQEQQASRRSSGGDSSYLASVPVPEISVDGKILNAHVEYLRVER